MVMRLLALYGNLVKKSPFITQIGTSGVLTTVGDVVAQKLENRQDGYNFRRTAVMSACGFFYFGPIVSVWLMFLKRMNLRPVFNVLCDQAFAAPTVNAGFVFLHPILSGKTVEEAKTIFKNTYINLLKRAYMVWFPAQTINFVFVPFEFRMLYIQSVALLWNTYLSYHSNSSLRHVTNKETEDCHND